MHAQERATPDPKLAAGPIWPEALAERYVGRWVIYRDLARDGTRDVWVAEPRHSADCAGKKITADDIDSLAEQLAAAER